MSRKYLPHGKPRLKGLKVTNSLTMPDIWGMARKITRYIIRQDARIFALRLKMCALCGRDNPMIPECGGHIYKLEGIEQYPIWLCSRCDSEIGAYNILLGHKKTLLKLNIISEDTDAEKTR